MTIEVRYLGHLGNNLFQYALGRLLAEELDAALVCRPAAAAPWNGVERAAGIVDRLDGHVAAFADARQTLAGRRGRGEPLRYVLGERPAWSGHGIDLGHLLRRGAGRTIVLQGYFQRSEYYLPYAARLRRWLTPRTERAGPDFGPDDVLVHLRQSIDMFALDRALDLGYYVRALDALGPARTYVCGLGLGPAVRRALAPFDPIYLDLPAIATLELMVRAPRIVLANSTFSWWGAFLSRADTVVFPYPVRGYWGEERADVALAVAEPRYRYVRDVAVQHWRPFQPVRGARLRLATAEGGDTRLLIDAPNGTRVGLVLSAALAGLAEWVARRREPFGVADVVAAEVTVASAPQVVELLLALASRGALELPAAAADALRAYYGLGA